MGGFHTADSNFDGGGDGTFPVRSTQRNSVEDQRSSYCLAQENYPLDSVCPVRMTAADPGLRLPAAFHVLTEEIFFFSLPGLHTSKAHLE